MNADAVNWDALGPAARHDPSTLGPATVPARPGVYAWFRDGAPLYVDAARNLGKRVTEIDLHGRSGRGTTPSHFQPRLVAYLSHEGEDLPANPHERRAFLDRWIRGCQVAWIETASFQEALDRGKALLAVQTPSLNEWQERPGEDRWLLQYLRRRGGDGDAGRVYVEVPLGGAARYGKGAKTRFIDAVLFPEVQSFRADLEGHAAEIIEVKRTLNRTVIGQLVVAEDMVGEEWEGHAELALVAVVRGTDPALEWVCRRRSIRVEVVEG